MKHDAHIVKNFRARTVEALHKNNVAVCKIIQFTDQDPSQYKNKTAFCYLAESNVPMQCHFFGIRHGKGPCDACIGYVKQGITRLVKNETEVVNPGIAFYEAALKHLQKPLKYENVCQHHTLMFELHKKIGMRPKTIIGFLCLKHIKFTVLATQVTHHCCISIILLVAVNVVSMQEIAQIVYVQTIGKGTT